MTNKFAVITAAIFHYCTRFAVFISPFKSQCYQGIGGVPALIILIGICFFLIDIELFSQQYNRYHVYTFRVIEIILSLLAIEFSMIMIWSRIESGLVMLMKHVLSRGELYNEMGGDNFVTLIIGGISISFLLYSVNVSNSSDKITKIIADLLVWSKSFYQKLMNSMHSLKENNHTEPVVTTMHIYRDPGCPIHGDHEINLPNSRNRRMK